MGTFQGTGRTSYMIKCVQIKMFLVFPMENTISIDKPTLDLLYEAANFFALGEPIRIEPVSFGLANRNFFLTSAHGQYVIKDALIHSPQEIKQEIMYLERLRRYAYPVPAYLQGANNEWLYCPPGHTIAAQSRVPGVHPQVSPSVCRNVGAALARLHQIPFAGLPETKNWMTRTFLKNMLKELQAANLQYRDQAIQSCEKFLDWDLSHLPQAIVHNDVYPDNMLFDGPDLKTILDWEETGVGAAVMDVGHAVYGFCRQKGEIIDTYFNALLRGYTDVRPLLDQELEQLCSAVQYVALTNSVWLLVQFGILTPDEEKLGWASAYWQYNLDGLVLPAW